MRAKKEQARERYASKVRNIGRRLRMSYRGGHDSLHTACAYVLSGRGKRLRPFLVLVSAEAVGGSPATVYDAAIAMELLHNATLVHDDIMDDGQKRHGKTSLHKAYGTNVAILAGDLLFALAYANLLKSRSGNTRDILSRFTRGIVDLCEGQGLDGEFESRQDVSLAEYRRMIYKKTAALTAMCCSMGARLSGAPARYEKAVSDYGKYLGMAFQIQDDLLDVIAKEDELGKTVGSDLAQGKKTYLLLRAMEKARGADRASLLKLMMKKKIRGKEVRWYRQRCIALGVVEDARKEAERYLTKALRSIAPLPDNEGKKLLLWLAKELLVRST